MKMNTNLKPPFGDAIPKGIFRLRSNFGVIVFNMAIFKSCHLEFPATIFACGSKGKYIQLSDSVVLELIPRPLLLKREGEERPYKGKDSHMVREEFRSKTRCDEVSSLNILFILIRDVISSVVTPCVTESGNLMTFVRQPHITYTDTGGRCLPSCI